MELRIKVEDERNHDLGYFSANVDSVSDAGKELYSITADVLESYFEDSGYKSSEMEDMNESALAIFDSFSQGRPLSIYSVEPLKDFLLGRDGSLTHTGLFKCKCSTEELMEMGYKSALKLNVYADAEDLSNSFVEEVSAVLN